MILEKQIINLQENLLEREAEIADLKLQKLEFEGKYKSNAYAREFVDVVELFKVLFDKCNSEKCLVNNKKIVLYGAGIRGKRISMIMQKCGFEVFCFVDRDDKKVGTMLDGKQIFPVEQLDVLDNSFICYITILNENACEDVKDTIKKRNPNLTVVASGDELIDALWFSK